MKVDPQKFDLIADDELRHLERVVGDLDPDETDVHLSMGVLKITLADGQQIVVNSHRAAGQIWMAAFRQAWHFSPVEKDGRWTWRTDKGEELRGTLGRLLAERLGREVTL